MIQACPITIINKCGALLEHVAPIPQPEYSYTRNHFESYETFGEILDRLGAEDSYNIDRDSVVLSTYVPTNTWCGGEAILGVTIAIHRTSHYFRVYSRSLYISRDDEGNLSTAIPA